MSCRISDGEKCVVADIGCLRSKTTLEIQRASWNIGSGNLLPQEDSDNVVQVAEPFSPVIDNIILTDQPNVLIAKVV